MWHYLDDGGSVQGPFGSAEMDEWNEEGFFNPTLMVAFEKAENIEDFIPLMLY